MRDHLLLVGCGLRVVSSCQVYDKDKGKSNLGGVWAEGGLFLSRFPNKLVAIWFGRDMG